MSTGLEIIVFDPASRDGSMLRTALGKVVSAYRQHHHLSQVQLASRMGVGKSTISKIENGKFAISVDYLEKLSRMLGIKIVVSPSGSASSPVHSAGKA